MKYLAVLALVVQLVDCLGSVTLGNVILREFGYKALYNQRVAILSNPTGVFPDSLVHIVDDLHSMSTSSEGREKNISFVAIFSPEHGFRGEKQAETGDPEVYIDNSTGLPVYSAYSMTAEELSKVITRQDITSVVVDMQDVGVRLYTYVWTMYKVMEAIALASNISSASATTKLLVCDRPNPLGGLQVSGPLLNMSCCASGYGRAPIPHVHGMTIGELALFFEPLIFGISEHKFVEVIKMKGWSRHMSTDVWDEPNGLLWVPPSPNIPTPLSAVAYASSVFLEATTVAEGRGTTKPFEIFGAPFVDAQV